MRAHLEQTSHSLSSRHVSVFFDFLLPCRTELNRITFVHADAKLLENFKNFDEMFMFMFMFITNSSGFRVVFVIPIHARNSSKTLMSKFFGVKWKILLLLYIWAFWTTFSCPPDTTIGNVTWHADSTSEKFLH